MRVLLMLNGMRPNAGLVRKTRAACDLRIAVDGGLEHFPEDAAPEFVVGDLDSAPAKDGPWQILELADQSRTDLEKTLLALGLGLFKDGERLPYDGERLPLDGTPTELVVMGAFHPNRLDQVINNLLVLDRIGPAMPIQVISEQTDIHRATPARRLVLDTIPGQTVSILPFGPVTLSSYGLKWELDGDRLAPRGSVSQSNEAVGSQVTVQVSAGSAWVFLAQSSAGESG